MKKEFLYFAFFAIGNLASWGQTYIIIDRIILDNVIEVKDTGLYISHWGGGPTVTMSVSITNTSPGEIKIYQDENYELYCTYEYNGYTHKSADVFLTIDDNNPLVIPPDSTYNEILSTNLFLPFHTIELTDVVIYDHSLVLNEAIASLKMVLRIGKEKYVSNNNPIVTRGDYFYYEQKWEDD